MNTDQSIETERKEEAEECCPLFHPEKWNEKEFHWNKKQFIKAAVPSFFHTPLLPLMKKRIVKLMEKANGAHKLSENKEETLLLFRDPNPFKSEFYLAVEGEVPGVVNKSLTGTFQSKVFDGKYKDIPGFFKRMKDYLAGHGEKADDYYVHYAYCPKCAEEHGHNYMVFFAKTDEAA